MSEPERGVMLQAFTWQSGGDGQAKFWQQLADRASSLAEAGFKSIWLPPACKAQGGTDDVGYGIYDLFDLGQYEQKGTTATRWGTAEQLVHAIQKCNDAGLITLADIVLNHRMGGDETERFQAVPVGEEDRTEEQDESTEIEAWTHFTFPGRGDEHSDFHWRWHHFTAVDLEEDDTRRIYRVADKHFSEQVGLEKGNYDYLMGCDVDLDQEDVREELFAWGRWFCQTTHIGGFRIDAAKHMDASFIRDFVGHLQHEAGRALPSVCEFAIEDPEAIVSFIQQTECSVHAFDFPLRARFVEASVDAAGFDLRTLFDQTLVQRSPDHAATFVDNHDTAPSKGEDAPDPVEAWFKPIAYAAILLRRSGWPCVFIGDYDASGPGQHNFGEDRRSDLGQLIERLVDLRRRYGFGEQVDHFDNPRVIAWRRLGDDDHPGQLVVICATGDEGRIDIVTDRPGETFVDLLGGDAEAIADDHGRVELSHPAGGIAVWGSAS